MYLQVVKTKTQRRAVTTRVEATPMSIRVNDDARERWQVYRFACPVSFLYDTNYMFTGNYEES